MNYDDDADGGDISLSGLPSSSSMPHLSGMLVPAPKGASSTTPTPKLYGKSLWPNAGSASPNPSTNTSTNTFMDIGDHGDRGESNSGTPSRVGTPSMSLDSTNTPRHPAGISRPGSATPLSSTSGGGSGYIGYRGGGGDSGESTPIATPTTSSGPSTAPLGFAQRSASSSSISRSRSINARLESAASGNTSTSASPSPRTSTFPSTIHGSGSNGNGNGNGTASISDSNANTLGIGRSQGESISGGNASPARTPSMRIGYARRPGDPRPPPLVNDQIKAAMGRWIKEIVVCNFDLERGPVIERRALGRRWGAGEKENVAFSSFPDTSLFSEGSILFSFKIRSIQPDPGSLHQPEPPSPMPDRFLGSDQKESPISPLGQATLSPPNSGSGSSRGAVSATLPSPASISSGAATPVIGQNGMTMSSKAEEYRKWDERGREWLYGYVWFEQRKDRGIARGYMQKSLVILSHLPFPGLFFAVLERVAPIFFEHGYSALEAACNSVASWPDPTSNTILELPFMSDILTVKLPDDAETPQLGTLASSTTSVHEITRPVLASLPHSTPLQAFGSLLPALWSLWECLLLAEPILVIAPDPRRCSEIVWWLRDLFRPIPPAGDFRPYLHIHDHDFSLLVNSNKPQAGIVVGVTNPFFRNAAAHWPNVISIPSDRPKRVVNSGSSSPRPDTPEGFLSRRHRSVSKDRPLLKRLEQLVAEGKYDDPEGNEALRTHFQQLTEKMLVPLNRYFQTLVPTLSPLPNSPIPTASSLKPFSLPSFLSHLRSTGPNPLSFRTKGLSTKSRVENDFYAAFCMSPTFAGWLHARIDSLGLAVAAQTPIQGPTGHTLSIPNATSFITPKKTLPGAKIAGKRNNPLGLGIRTPDKEHPDPLLRYHHQHQKSYEVDRSDSDTLDYNDRGSDATRPSSESSNSHWARQSEEVARVPSPSSDFFGRRGSEGFVKSLGALNIRGAR